MILLDGMFMAAYQMSSRELTRVTCSFVTSVLFGCQGEGDLLPLKCQLIRIIVLFREGTSCCELCSFHVKNGVNMVF